MGAAGQARPGVKPGHILKREDKEVGLGSLSPFPLAQCGHRAWLWLGVCFRVGGGGWGAVKGREGPPFLPPPSRAQTLPRGSTAIRPPACLGLAKHHPGCSPTWVYMCMCFCVPHPFLSLLVRSRHHPSLFRPSGSPSFKRGAGGGEGSTCL